MTNKKDSKDVFKILLTAIITSSLTLCSSYLLLTKQFSKEQEYWIKRTKTERLQSLLDHQIKLFEEINSGILNIEVMAKDLKLSAVEFTVKLKGEKVLRDEKNELISGKEMQEKQVSYQNKLNELGSKIQMVELYFGPSVDTVINNLSSSLEKNYRHNLIFKDSLNTQTLSSVLDYFKKDFETIDILEKNRLNLLKTLHEKMTAISTVLNEEK